MRTWADYLRIAACLAIGAFLVDWLGLLAWFGIFFFTLIAFVGYAETQLLRPNPEKPESERRKRSRMRRVK